jgi:membrane peptidoglycan carboxypeptidase
MAGIDRPEWPPRSPRPGDLGDAGEYPYSYDVEDDDYVDEGYGPPSPPPPGREMPRPAPGRDRRPPSGDKLRAARGPKAHSKGNLLWRWRRGFFVLALVGMVGVAAGVSAIAQTKLPPLQRMKATTFVCPGNVGDGECNATTALVKTSADEDRVFVNLEEIPEQVRDAVISAEDRDFYEHKGVNPMSIGRALVRDLKGGGSTQGGSTITQQLVKNAFLIEPGQSAERTVTRKLKEAVLAMKIEKQMSKDEILERYLNEIYFGRNAYGIQAASWAYFNKPIQETGIPEGAYLAGLIRAPEAADVKEHPEEATRRRQTVLDAMLEEGYMSDEEYAIVEGMDLNSYVMDAQTYKRDKYLWPQDPAAVGSTLGIEYVNDFVKSELEDKVAEALGLDLAKEGDQRKVKAEIDSGGLRVYTTLDTTMQEQAYNAVWGVLDNPLEDPSAGLVAIDDQGFIRAMVGGRDFNAQTPSATVNLATGNVFGRQVGSTFKPIALATALQQGFSLERSQVAAPGETEQIDWPGCDSRKFKNYSTEGAPTGNMNLVDATKVSSNTAYVNLMVELGVNPVTDMAKKLGMTLDRRTANQRSNGLLNCPTTVLGSEESDPLEMAEVFSTFANRGIHKEPTIIRRIERIGEDGAPEPLWNWTPKNETALSTNTADLVTHTLEQVVADGTGTAAGAGIDTPVAGKTGTTSNNMDAWFVGYVPKLTAAVWMGYPDPQPVLNPDGTPVMTESGKPKTFVPTMNSNADTGRPVRGRAKGVTGGSFPAEIWNAFMKQVVEGMPADALQFVEPTPEALRAGTPLQGDYVETPDTTMPEDPDATIPDNTTIVTRPGPPTSTTSSSTPTTIWPPVTTSTTDPRPGGGGGGGGGGGNG